MTHNPTHLKLKVFLSLLFVGLIFLITAEIFLCISDISESRSKDFEVVYRFDPSETAESEVFETAAAMMGERQNLELQLSEIDENAVMETHLNCAHLTLSNILNTLCKSFFLLLMP